MATDVLSGREGEHDSQEIPSKFGALSQVAIAVLTGFIGKV